MAPYPSLHILIRTYFYSSFSWNCHFLKKLKQTYKQTLEGCQIPSKRVCFGLLLSFRGTICLAFNCYMHISTYLQNR